MLMDFMLCCELFGNKPEHALSDIFTPWTCGEVYLRNVDRNCHS